MICWDSRTVHCSTPSLVHPSNHGDKDLPVCSTDELLRMAGYICMVPSSWATSEVIDKRVRTCHTYLLNTFGSSVCTDIFYICTLYAFMYI